MRWWTLLATGGAVLIGAVAATLKPMKEQPQTTASPAAVERITFGGGCFWCLEAVFQRLHGVTKVVSGYAGGSDSNPTYEEVCSGDTGHAEVVQLTFDPNQISYQKLLEVFWAAHDPTSVLEEATFKGGKLFPKGTAYQGADVGSQYRSIILFESESQRQAAEASRKVAQADFTKPIATEIVPLAKFFPAEAYHQNYFNLNQKRNPYCSVVIAPKLKKLLKQGLIAEEPLLP